jgi:enamine deaminase RidA (YjgF/YER057c/UK114 family)
MELIQSPELPPPGGHYSQAVVTRSGLVFVSGVLPARDLFDASFEGQCGSVFAQCEAILRAAGCGLDCVVQCTAYLAGVEHWPAFDTAYAGVFGAHRPARAVVPVPALHYGFLVELQLVAERPAAE